ncbi:MAG: hypothetical protein ABEJ26_08475 [Halosimplex sp.]
MYDRDQVARGVRRGVENPGYFGRELNRLYHRRCYRDDFNTDGVAVVDEEWDTLVILDACRYDDFRELHDLPGDLQSRESRGSHTVEFLVGNFAGRELLDTVYVTASPQLHSKGVDVRFHAVENVWQGDGWDEDAGTVRPETMADRVLAAAERYPEKRLIAHFVQPHYPFLDTDAGRGGSLRNAAAIDIWGQLMKGTAETAPEAVREAYRRNLQLALPAVERLLADLSGRTVVTADHGNMFGERARPIPVREWGHPPGIYTEQLVRVPWLVHGGDRKRVTASPPVEGEPETESDPRERLKQLGYIE